MTMLTPPFTVLLSSPTPPLLHAHRPLRLLCRRRLCPLPHLRRPLLPLLDRCRAPPAYTHAIRDRQSGHRALGVGCFELRLRSLGLPGLAATHQGWCGD